ncbi:MAG: pyrroline-5-carboxylate reductase [Prevotella sp.]|uniref:pyrroline-5-carboxylate reductase family protein n=1 Tax=Prevotella sp. AGR2160 TaxID=1280674 RepID=UPI0004176041|nr:pyrroline-5-carboxylate reductase [Prevotella sp. AGR2160]MDD5861832.1 pyrroline-5-carboxylate reductase [Prevotella sp.]
MKITIIGAGAMGGSFAEGLLHDDTFQPADLTVANPHAGKLEKFQRLGAAVTTDNKTAVAGADIIAIVVKPWLVEEVINEIKSSLDYDHQIILNMAAAIPSSQLLKWLDKKGKTPVLFQVIPNIAIAVKASMTFIVPVGALPAQTEQVKTLFDHLGESLITDEQHLGAGTTLASCGIAYAMRYFRAASEGGVELGFKADIAKDIVLQTCKGAVALLQSNGNHPEAEIDKVTTPGGLTIKGLNTMEQYGFTNAVIQGLKAGVK